MLVELTVEDLAIIDRAFLRLQGGFTALTGETGAGKSLLIDAVELALGGRADTDQVRSGAIKATVGLEVDLSERPDLRKRFQGLGIEGSETLSIRREVYAEGKSQARVNGKAVPMSVLRQIGSELVDLHGQHDHQSLLDPMRHMTFLDAWIGEPAERLKERVGIQYEIVQTLRRKLAARRQGKRELEQRIDLLRFQIDEIEGVAPRSGELAELEARLQRLQHAEKIANAVALALAGLADDELNAMDRVAIALRELDSVLRHDPQLDESVGALRTVAVELQEAVALIRTYGDALEADPALLEDTAARTDTLRRLLRKYGDDEAAVLAFAEAARQELDDLTLGVEDEDSLVVALDQREDELGRLASELSLVRKERAVGFAESVREALIDLAMERAIFEVAFSDCPVDATGCDRVEFLLSANKGETPRPLAKIASGGELSRVMLAIKSVFVGRSGIPTLIFDEVDAGLGGRAAAAVARRLEILANHCQVLVISHLPQIASRASQQFQIGKFEHGGRTVTELRVLEPEEREHEIARMLAGEQVTEAALRHARELLAVRMCET